VWVGNAAGQGSENMRSMPTADPVLFDLFSIMPPPKEKNSVPNDALCEQTVCADSGFVASENCNEIKIVLRPSAAPLGKLCPYCKIISLTPDKKFQATVSDMKGEYEGFLPIIEKRFVLPPSIEYYYTKQALGYKHLPPFLPEHQFAQRDELSILFPEQGAQIILPIEIDGTPGNTVMQAASRSKSAVLYWDLDGEFLGETRGEHTMALRPQVGWHTLTITDSNGTRRTRQFKIVEDGM
ncbi:MAG: penicillin-binding protein 1C, partial [Treponemataceae bacterium]|nr:penicillin-binding protein 1C [Treponemataceae bacterium]